MFCRPTKSVRSGAVGKKPKKNRRKAYHGRLKKKKKKKINLNKFEIFFFKGKCKINFFSEKIKLFNFNRM